MISNLGECARRAVQAASFDIDFSPQEQRELEATTSGTRSDDATDLSALLWSLIDNDTSRDLDQVEVAEQLPQNVIRVRIGIADVDAFVPKNSLLDVQAARNTCSVYTGIETFPMLPRALSEDLTSLLPNQDRRAIVISYVVDANGETSQIEIARAVVRNRAKLVYENVGNWLDDAPGDKSSTRIAELETIGGLREQLLLQHEAATRLQKAREAKGALDLDSAEVTPIMKDGRIVSLRSQPKNAARRIIENFMVSANMALAQWLPEHGFSALARVVRTPERWPRIREIAQNLGDNLPTVAEPLALSEFLERQRKIAPANFAQLSLSVVKLLGPGNYELVRPQDKIGHFGLGAARYTHSTAPNRRFPDLVTQRLKIKNFRRKQRSI